MNLRIQEYIFDASLYTEDDVREYLQITNPVCHWGDSIHYRVRPPFHFQLGTLKTVSLENGVTAKMGILKTETNNKR